MIALVVIGVLAIGAATGGVLLTLALDPRSFYVWPVALVLGAVSIVLQRRELDREEQPPGGEERPTSGRHRRGHR
jgi:hypothetical protein